MTGEHHSDSLRFEPMDRETAREIISWRYEAPYDMYDPLTEAPEDALQSFTDPENAYFSVRGRGNRLIAYVCFGEEARVAGGRYPEDAIDIGAGMRPELTGQGLGQALVREAIAFARANYGASRFRATVAAFNERALRAAQRVGFVPVRRFTRPSDGLEFVILVRSDARSA